jgi:hypothetical protein
VEARLAMVWQLTMESWRLAGREIPQYKREDTPVRYVTPQALLGELTPD